MNQFRLLVRFYLKFVHAFTLTVHFAKSTIKKVYTRFRINAMMILKNNHNKNYKLIDL